MRTEKAHSAPLATPRTLAVALALFATGLTCGWWLKGNQDSEIGAIAAPTLTKNSGAEMNSSLPANPDPTQVNEFLSRLHDLFSMSKGATRDRAISGIADDFDLAQVREALAELERTNIPERGRIRDQLLARWGELDPEAAMDYAMALPETSG